MEIILIMGATAFILPICIFFVCKYKIIRLSLCKKVKKRLNFIKKEKNLEVISMIFTDIILITSIILFILYVAWIKKFVPNVINNMIIDFKEIIS